MNWWMYTADQTTHLKIVVVGFLAALLLSFIGVAAREQNLGADIMTAQAPTVIKASTPMVFTVPAARSASEARDTEERC
jgi:hypothetical protein